MFYLTTHSTHFIYGYMASDRWLWTILIVRKETRCRHIGYSFRLAARILLYASSHRQDNTYHGLCYTCRGALAGTRNSSVDKGKASQADTPPSACYRFPSDCSYSLVPASACGPPFLSLLLSFSLPFFFLPVPDRGTGATDVRYNSLL